MRRCDLLIVSGGSGLTDGGWRYNGAEPACGMGVWALYLPGNIFVKLRTYHFNWDFFDRRESRYGNDD